MADPLSVAASIGGLFALAIKLKEMAEKSLLPHRQTPGQLRVLALEIVSTAATLTDLRSLLATDPKALDPISANPVFNLSSVLDEALSHLLDTHILFSECIYELPEKGQPMFSRLLKGIK